MFISRKCDLPECGWAVAPLGLWAWSGFAGRVLRLGDFRERGWVRALVFLLGSWNCQETWDGDWSMRSGACAGPTAECVAESRLLSSGWSSHLPGNQNAGRLIRAGSGNEIRSGGAHPSQAWSRSVMGMSVKWVLVPRVLDKQRPQSHPPLSLCVHVLSFGHLNEPGGMASYRKPCVLRSAPNGLTLPFSVCESEGNHPVQASVSLPVKWRHTFRVSQLSARHAAGTQWTGTADRIATSAYGWGVHQLVEH